MAGEHQTPKVPPRAATATARSLSGVRSRLRWTSPVHRDVVVRLHECDSPYSLFDTVRFLILTQRSTGWPVAEHSTRYRAITSSQLTHSARRRARTPSSPRGAELGPPPATQSIGITRPKLITSRGSADHGNDAATLVPLLVPRTGSHVGGRGGAVINCCSEAVVDRSGSDGQVAAWALEGQR